MEPQTHLPHRAAIALGSNLGDRAASLNQALSRLAKTQGVTLLKTSTPIQTAPVGDIPQGPYLNAAALLGTSLKPRELLEAMLRIEAALGRTREVRWGPRTIDLDLILFDDLVISEPGLIVPHPRLAEREFVLRPLSEICPHWKVPSLDRTITELLAALQSPRPGPAGSHAGANDA